MQRFTRHLAPAWLSVVALALLVGTLALALRSPDEGHDGYLFLLQSRRLTDPDFAGIPFIATRPRFFVGLLAAFESTWRFVSGVFPSLVEYHCLSAVLAFVSVAAVAAAAIQFIGMSGGCLVGALFAAHYLIAENATLALADILSAALVSATCASYLWSIRSLEESDKKLANYLAIACGISGGLVATTKYQLFFFLPVLLVCHGLILIAAKESSLRFTDRRRSQWQLAGVALLAYVLSIEALQRALGDWREGFFFTLRLHGRYAHLIDQPIQAQPAWLYAADIVTAYGWPFVALALAAAGFWAGRVATEGRPQSPTSAKSIAGLSVVATHLFFILFLQVVKHKEIRYALPLLPVVIALGVLAIRVVQQKIPAKWAPIGAIAWALLFIHPIERSSAEIQSQWREASKVDRIETDRFWSFMRDSDSRCRFVLGCEWMAGREKLDAPNYQFHLPHARVRVSVCEKGKGPENPEIALGPTAEPGTCLALPAEDGNGLIVEKWIATRLTSTEAAQRKRVMGEHCRSEKGRFGCVVTARFFFRGEQPRLTAAPFRSPAERGPEK